MTHYEKFLQRCEQVKRNLKDPLVAKLFVKKHYPEFGFKDDIRLNAKIDDNIISTMSNTILYSEYDKVVKHSDFVVRRVTFTLDILFQVKVLKKMKEVLLDTFDRTFIIDKINNEDYMVRGGYYYIFANKNSVYVYFGYSGCLIPINTIDDSVAGLNYMHKVRKELECKYPELYQKFLEMYYGGAK